MLRAEVEVAVRGGGEEAEEILVLEERVEAAEAEAEKDARGEGAAALAGDQDVRAGCAFGVGQGAVLFDDELAAQRDHEEHAEPSAEEREREDAVDSRSKPRKISAGRVKMTPEAIDWPALPVVCTMLFSRMRGAAEGAEDGDREHGDRDRGGDRKSGAQADVDGDRAEEDAEEAAQDEGARGELRARLRVRERRV